MKKIYILLLVAVVGLSTDVSAMDISQKVRDMIKEHAQDPTFRSFIVNKLKKVDQKALDIQKDFNHQVVEHRESLDWDAFEFICSDDPRQPVSLETRRSFIVATAIKELGFDIDRIFFEEKLADLQYEKKLCTAFLAVLDEK
jgi:hypothetical protein